MNIMYINHENSLGGGTKSLLGMIDKLRLYKDVNITVVIPYIGNGSLEKQLISNKINYVKVHYRWWMIPKDKNKFIPKINSIVLNFISINRIAKIAKDLKIDIIHSNSSVINIGGLVSERTGIPHVWHIREFGDEDHGLVFINKRAECINFINKNSEKVIAISKSVFKKFEGDILPNKLILIYNGIEKRDLKEKRDNTNKKEFNILLAGAIKNSKGQKQAILAVEKLIKEYGYNDIKLNLAGANENGYADYLKELIKKLGIEKHIKFLGFTNKIDEIRDRMDLELVCSKKEAFGRVTVEAMMSGNPIIGSDTGATVELIEPNFNGLLYCENNIVDLAKKIKIFIENPNEGIRMGSNGREFALNNFTTEINAMNIYNTYKKLMNELCLDKNQKKIEE